MKEKLHIFGIRHHGAGSSKSLLEALKTLEPDCILVEGLVEANSLIPFCTHEAMQPPVALLAYAVNEPKHSVFYPFAEFSPEWQAISYANTHEIHVEFMDLPQSNQLAINLENTDNQLVIGDNKNEIQNSDKITQRPLEWVAQLTGFGDSEQWWEHFVEKRQDSTDIFEAILQMMSALRKEFPEQNPMILRREAAMRKTIRKKVKEGYQKIAIVCGAWHAPAFLEFPTIKYDNAQLKGLPKIKIDCTWSPWTFERLSFGSGYRSGLHSPKWYEILWKEGKNAPMYWTSLAARLLREQDFEASTAQVMDSLRLAQNLASLRDVPLAGLNELQEAAKSVLCFGNSDLMELIHTELVVGKKMGKVPDEARKMPIQKDFSKLIKTLRLKIVPEKVELKLDLRKELHLKKSHFLHRLAILKLNWGWLLPVYNKKGSFHEDWTLLWQEEFEILLIEANMWGNTVENAASMYAIHLANSQDSLKDLAELLKKIILADLNQALSPCMQILENKMALSQDVFHLIEVFNPIVQVLKYGNIRQSDTKMLQELSDKLIDRIFVALPSALSSLNEDAITEIYPKIINFDYSLSLLNDVAQQKAWLDLLKRLLNSNQVGGLLQGKFCRILFDRQVLTMEELTVKMSFALSSGTDMLQSATWLEGFLEGSVQLILHHHGLWNLLNTWMDDLDEENFMQTLPLLRRAFSAFSISERQKINLKVQNKKHVDKQIIELQLNPKRAERVSQILNTILK